MSNLPVVGERNRAEVLAALAGGRVIAVALDGGYHLAALPDQHDALAVARSGSSTSSQAGSWQIMVGLRGQATALASSWSNETRILTDRMWPGPLTVVVSSEVLGTGGTVRITMPASRALRALCRESGPLVLLALQHGDGQPLLTREEVEAQLTGHDIALVVDGGTCRATGPTVVDCTGSPPFVRQIGAFPESYVDAALMMGNRRSRRRTRKVRTDTGTSP